MQNAWRNVAYPLRIPKTSMSRAWRPIGKCFCAARSR
jgi:hypothetical protein